MSKYKVVKDPDYSSIYNVYKKRFGLYWTRVYYVTASSMEDAQRAALNYVHPPVVYFEA